MIPHCVLPRHLSSKYHPHNWTGTTAVQKKTANEIHDLIDEAASVLMDEARHQQYDSDLLEVQRATAGPHRADGHPGDLVASPPYAYTICTGSPYPYKVQAFLYLPCFLWIPSQESVNVASS